MRRLGVSPLGLFVCQFILSHFEITTLVIPDHMHWSAHADVATKKQSTEWIAELCC